MDFRKFSYVISVEILQLKASKIAQKFNIPVAQFKANYGRFGCFLNCRQFSIRRIITSRKLPEMYEEKVINFQKFLIVLRK
jgi:hypothetical protein